jgi:hypothetical protein
LALDPFRDALWADPRVDFWFAQNMLLYVSSEIVHRNHRLEEELLRTNGAIRSIVHPRLYLQKARRAERLNRLLDHPWVRAARSLRRSGA